MGSFEWTFLKVCETTILVFGVALFFLLSDLVIYDTKLQQQIGNYALYPPEEFREFVNSNNSSESAEGNSFQTKRLEIENLVSSTVNWQHGAFYCQVVLIIISMGHMLSQLGMSPDRFLIKLDQSWVTIIRSILSTIGFLASICSRIHSDDGKFREILEYTIHKIVKEEKDEAFELQMDLRWLFTSRLEADDPVSSKVLLLRNEEVGDEGEERAYQYRCSKYIAMVLFLIQCLLYIVMFQIIVTFDKPRFEGPLIPSIPHVRIPMADPTSCANSTENSTGPSLDSPPPYETVILEDRKSPVQITHLSPYPNATLHGINLDGETNCSLPVPESNNSQSQLPCYKVALLKELIPFIALRCEP